MRPKLFVLLLVMYLLTTKLALYGAYINSMPKQLSQLDGTKLSLFTTGDEFYNWLHDKEGFTIAQNDKGWYVYLDKNQNGELIFTNLIAGRDNPVSGHLTPRTNISPEKMEELRHNSALNQQRRVDTHSHTIGSINNIAIYIRFADQEEFTENNSFYNDMFNGTTGNTMQSYFLEASYNQLNITTSLFPTSSSTVISWQDTLHASGYYMPYNATTNPIGTHSGTEAMNREQTLLVDAINGVRSQIPADLVVDSNGDGYVDNVCMIIQSSNFVPHRAWMVPVVYINGKRVSDYNLQTTYALGNLGANVLCHEMFHTMGAPDLYHYGGSLGASVGRWDLMCNNTNTPQHMSSYMKYRYGHWISDIPVISASGTYTLNPLTSPSGQCYKINSPNSSTQFFIVEFRKKTGTFENSLPGSGMLIWRINSTFIGNAGGPPDELYVYRPGGTPTADGTVDSANFSTETGRISFSSSTNPSCFLQDGSNGDIIINTIGSSAGNTMSFYCEIRPSSLTGNAGNLSNTLSWTIPAGGTQTGYKIYRNNVYLATTTALTYTDNTVANGIPYTYYVTASYNSNPVESAASNSVTLVASSNPLITIGSNPGSNAFPFDMREGFARDASLFLSSEINQFGTLMYLNWYVSNASNTAAPVIIRLKTVDDTSFVSGTWANLIDGATTVYNGTLSFPNLGWKTINLTTPFVYSTGNLLVLIETNYGGNGATTYPYFRSNHLGSRLHEVWIADISAPVGLGIINVYRPYIQIQMAIVNPPTGLTATAGSGTSSLSWQAPIGSTGSISGYNVFRNGTLITPTPLTTLSYTDTGLTNGTTYTYYVTAVYSNPIGESGASLNVTSIPDSPILVLPVVTLSDSLRMGNTAVQHLEMQNRGGLPLNYTIQIAEPQSAGFERQSSTDVNRQDRTLTWLTCSALSGSIESGQSFVQDISFISANSVPGLHQAELRISSNDPLYPMQIVTIGLEVTMDRPVVHINSGVIVPRFTWQAVPGANVYRIYRSSIPYDNFIYESSTPNLYFDADNASSSFYQIVAGYE